MRALIASTVLVSSSCSFIFVDGPPPMHEQLPYFDCSSSYTVPILDTLWTVLQTANLILASSVSDDEWRRLNAGRSTLDRHSAAGLYVVLAGLGGAGMWYGYSHVSDCKDAKNALMMRMAGGAGPRGPGTWPPAAVPARPPPAPAKPAEPDIMKEVPDKPPQLY